MTLIKSIRLLHAVSYVLISSQLLFYMLVLTQAMKIVTLENFMELRKAIDPIFAGLPRILYYIALLLSLVAVILSIQNPGSIIFITSCISFICIAADITIAMKYNVPINIQIDGYVQGDPGNTDWEMLRTQWLEFIQYRSFIGLVGVVSLITGLVFTNNG
jgi:hypothetical protein